MRKSFVSKLAISCYDNAGAFCGDSYDGVSCACASPFYDAYAFFLTAYRFKGSRTVSKMIFFQKGDKDREIFFRCQRFCEKNHLTKSHPIFVD
jgi:hypothetical protein